MKTLIIAILTLTTTFITAQNTTIWVGGTPGKETKWDEAKNWSNHRVPDEFSNVIILDVSTTTFSYPEIISGNIELNSLTIESNATISIHQNARLVVFDNIEGVAINDLKSQGRILVLNENSDHQKATILLSNQ